MFDHVDGGADAELTLGRNACASREWEFLPRCLVDVGEIDASRTLLERRVPAPLVLAPTGYSRLMHPAGELAVAAAAKQPGLPYALSTVASTSVEDLAASGPDKLWLQLYLWRDRGATEELVARAWASGYRVLAVSVDTAVPGRRSRDVRNGALGADAGAVGRAYLYGLMAAGQAGVAHALGLLLAQFTRTVALLGVTSVAELRAGGRELLRRRCAERTDRGGP